MKNKIWRQGDVLIERVENIPTTAKQQGRSGKIILAHGEVTGHYHALTTKDPADWWKDGNGLTEETFITLKKAGVVTHQEHSKIELPAGTYRVTRQQEYSPTAIRNVQD